MHNIGWFKASYARSVPVKEPGGHGRGNTTTELEARGDRREQIRQPSGSELRAFGPHNASRWASPPRCGHGRWDANTSVEHADQNPPQPWQTATSTSGTWAAASPRTCRIDSSMHNMP